MITQSALEMDLLRLEKALRIKLLGAYTEGQKTSVPAHHLTLGDIAEIRVRKK